MIKGGFTLIDDCDLEKANKISWHISYNRDHTPYVRGTIRENGKRRNVMLHRFLMGVLDEPQTLIDHRNGNSLDNQRSTNLRASSAVQNGQNKKLSARNQTGWKGVWKSKESNKFGAKIMAFGKSTHLGYFNCPTAAGLAYMKAAKELHGDFARMR